MGRNSLVLNSGSLSVTTKPSRNIGFSDIYISLHSCKGQDVWSGMLWSRPHSFPLKSIQRWFLQFICPTWLVHQIQHWEPCNTDLWHYYYVSWLCWAAFEVVSEATPRMDWPVCLGMKSTAAVQHIDCMVTAVVVRNLWLNSKCTLLSIKS